MIAKGKSHEGKQRKNNEDSIFVSTEKCGPMPNVFIVSDGMGGHNAGEVASRNAIEFFCEYVRAHASNEEELLDLIVSAARYANQRVYEMSDTNRNLYGMGATFTCCTSVGGKVFVAHIGDSRVYYIASETIEQKTTDHSYVNELVRAGRITPGEAQEHPKKNILTRALGVEPDVAVDGLLFDTEGKGTVLLCSDGLTNMLTDIDILRIVEQDNSLNDKVNQLIDEANARGGLDNISVILLDMTR